MLMTCATYSRVSMRDQDCAIQLAALQEYARRHPSSKLTTEKVRQIRSLRMEGRTQHEIANIIGISRTSVEGVLAGRTWKEIE